MIFPSQYEAVHDSLERKFSMYDERVERVSNEKVLRYPFQGWITWMNMKNVSIDLDLQELYIYIYYICFCKGYSWTTGRVAYTFHIYFCNGQSWTKSVQPLEAAPWYTLKFPPKVRAPAASSLLQSVHALRRHIVSHIGFPWLQNLNS